MYTTPGTTLPNGAIVVDTLTSGSHVTVLAVLPSNKITPWVIWRTLDPATGDAYSGTYLYTWDDVKEHWKAA